jgi:glutamate/aspartate transport system permease protein
MFGLDLSFFDLEMLRKFVLSGLIFSVQLTITATIGGVIFGTLLALMRLSGSRLPVSYKQIRAHQTG